MDTDYWKQGKNVTAGHFCDCLKMHVPADAVMHVCGNSRIYMNFSRGRDAFSTGSDPLSEHWGYRAVELWNET